MSHARVEEVSDSDPDDMDPSDFDPAKDSIIYREDMEIPMTNTMPPVPVIHHTSRPIPRPAGRPAPPAASPSPPLFPSSSPQMRRPAISQGRDIPRSYQCLYAVYFDRTRTRAEGRRVSRKLAVSNPLAKDILDAAQLLGLNVGFEPDKLHPKDWSNPGRVRVMLKDEDGRPANTNIKNKHLLYTHVARYLQSHPTTEQAPFRLRLQGMPVPDKPPGPPATPRGWKIGTILPLHSPALTGGGVSDNPFKEAMMEMQAQQGLPGMPAPAGAASEPKKKSKKKGKA
ncbi:signal recognition particle SEC65 subunit [Arthroderma uncinatum]|uniref:signal recognition particle SEC65 subunit n=1 Tax=Arthroderma uncinatum TaxID=74035 RepID=UPI00144AEF6F|nr:signal recognition particle SEC65 subunit [Arthroderma uncinatum]KAF3481057.1 signal recognition particle SEC65 subunit [Arthroderma uncinatum]